MHRLEVVPDHQTRDLFENVQGKPASLYSVQQMPFRSHLPLNVHVEQLAHAVAHLRKGQIVFKLEEKDRTVEPARLSKPPSKSHCHLCLAHTGHPLHEDRSLCLK